MGPLNSAQMLLPTGPLAFWNSNTVMAENFHWTVSPILFHPITQMCWGILIQNCTRISVVVRLNNVLIFLVHLDCIFLMVDSEMASMDRVKLNKEPVEIPEFLLSLNG